MFISIAILLTRKYRPTVLEAHVGAWGVPLAMCRVRPKVPVNQTSEHAVAC